MHAWMPRTLAALMLAWSVLMAFSALRTAWAQQPTDRAALEAELMVLADDLPPRGEVGYIAAGEDQTHEPVVQISEPGVLHVAQYVLAPRIIRIGSGVEYVIVRGEPAADEGSSGLAGYEPVGESRGAHRVYRRTR